MIASSRDSKSDCASHPSCRHNESVALTLDRYYFFTTSCLLLLTNNFVHSPCDPVSFLGCQKVCPVYECNISSYIGDFGDRYMLHKVIILWYNFYKYILGLSCYTSAISWLCTGGFISSEDIPIWS